MTQDHRPVTYFNLEQAVRDMWEIHGARTYQAALDSAEAAEKQGHKLVAGHRQGMSGFQGIPGYPGTCAHRLQQSPLIGQDVGC